MRVIGGRDSVHEAGEVFTPETLHCGVDVVEQVEACESFGHSRILGAVNAGIGTVEDMQPDIDVGTSGRIALLMPFDGLKFNKHRRERIDGPAGEVCAVVVPEVHVCNAGDCKEFFGDGCKNLLAGD